MPSSVVLNGWHRVADLSPVSLSLGQQATGYLSRILLALVVMKLDEETCQ
jgi:hypothetical protein